MNERSIVFMNGATGSGTSRLASATERQLGDEGISIAHLSIGDYVRKISRQPSLSPEAAAAAEHLELFGSALPLDDEIIAHIASRALQTVHRNNIVLLDGYPRYASQVDDIEELALKDGRRIRGMIVTKTSWETSVERALKRGREHPERATSLEIIESRLADFTSTFPDVLETLENIHVPYRIVDTSGSTPHTDRLGLQALRSFY